MARASLCKRPPLAKRQQGAGHLKPNFRRLRSAASHPSRKERGKGWGTLSVGGEGLGQPPFCHLFLGEYINFTGGLEYKIQQSI